MPEDHCYDDAMDRYLRARGWFSLSWPGDVHVAGAGFDSWGWGGTEPGSIIIVCVGAGQYIAAWISAETRELVIEEVTGPEALRRRAIELEHHTDHISTLGSLTPPALPPECNQRRSVLPYVPEGSGNPCSPT